MSMNSICFHDCRQVASVFSNTRLLGHNDRSCTTTGCFSAERLWSFCHVRSIRTSRMAGSTDDGSVCLSEDATSRNKDPLTSRFDSETRLSQTLWSDRTHNTLVFCMFMSKPFTDSRYSHSSSAAALHTDKSTLTKQINRHVVYGAEV